MSFGDVFGLLSNNPDKWVTNADGTQVWISHGKAYLPSGQPWTSDASVANDKSQWITPPPMPAGMIAKNQQDKALDSTTPFLESLYKDPSGGSDLTKTPLYNKLLTLGTDSTAEAYKTAKTTALARSNASGFGYEQPMAQGALERVEAEESKQLADVPTKAYGSVVNTGLQATAQRTGQAALYNPLGFANLDQQQSQLDYANKSALWKNLAKLGITAAGTLAGGPAGAAATGGLDSSWG